jgi:hypothetical protein
MSKTVFILGAGTSKDSGAPLMNEFLDRSRRLFGSGECGEKYREDFKLVLGAISDLQKIHSKSELDLYNIEEIFTAFEMAKLINKFPGELIKNVQDIDFLIKSLKKVIYVTLDRSTPLETGKTTTESLPNASGSYGKFAALLKTIRKIENEVPTIITFNYDLAIDYALYRYDFPINYCFTSKDERIIEEINLIKLHGSLNWFESQDKKNIIPYEISQKEMLIAEFQRNHSGEKYYFNIFDKIRDDKISYKGIDYHVKLDPFIIPPTWDKSIYHQELSKIWSQAALDLSTANNIYIIGYSLPVTDNFFRYLYALGSEGTELIQRLWVFNPDEKNVKTRFEEFIGIGIKDRFMFKPINFQQTVNCLREIYEKYDDPNFDPKEILDRY